MYNSLAVIAMNHSECYIRNVYVILVEGWTSCKSYTLSTFETCQQEALRQLQILHLYKLNYLSLRVSNDDEGITSLAWLAQDQVALARFSQDSGKGPVHCLQGMP